MKGENRILLFLLCASIELCYLFACATFVTTAIFHQAFPFPEAVGSFLLAALLTLLADGRGWRVIYVLGFQALGFLPALVRMISVFNSWSVSFLSQTWLADYFTNPTDAVDYFVFLLVIGWILVFWVGGVELARRPKDHPAIRSRFDRGLVAFFVLFLTKFYFQTVQGIQIDESFSASLLFPFFIFSLLAIGLARHEVSTPRNFLPGYQTIGVMLGFIVIVLLGGVGLVLFFLPYLTLVAKKGNDLFSIVSQPFLTVMVGILVWLFGTDFTSNTLPTQPAAPQGSNFQVSFPEWIEFLGKILAVGVVILVAVVLLAFVGGFVYSVCLWLFSKTEFDQAKSNPRHLLSSWLDPWRALAGWLRHRQVRRANGYGEGSRLYTALLIWGRHSSLGHLLNETPGEYGLRLAHQFPVLASEIESIIGAFNREVYGEFVLDEPQLAPARLARRKLGSPSYWSLRLKAWFVR